MLLKVFFDWLRSWLIGVGCSLIAAGMIGAITPEVSPIPIVASLVIGVCLTVLSLVMAFCALIPSAPSGE
jgi:hypothetical protein